MKENLLGLSDYTFSRTRARLHGLTDDEYLWEPVPGCWTVRPQPDGGFRADWAVELGGAGPFTTIAWRMWHLIGCYGARRNATWLNVSVPGGSAPIPAPQVTSDAGYAANAAPATAAAALRALDEAHDYWRQCLNAVTDETSAEKLGPIGGQYADSNRAGFALHMLDEFIHHGAEVALLRDLYRAEHEAKEQDPLISALLSADVGAVTATTAADPSTLDRLRASRPNLVLDAARLGRWHAVAPLLKLGFAADVAEGAGPLHHAAAAGRLDVVKLLIEKGAHVHREDETWHSPPRGWAEYFGRREVVEYFESL